MHGWLQNLSNFRYFFTGMAAPLGGAVPIFALNFLGFDLGKRLLKLSPDAKLNSLELAAARGFSRRLAVRSQFV